MINGSVTITTDAGLAQISDVAKVTGQLVIAGPGITSTDLRELAVLSEVDRLVVGQLPNLTSLAGMTGLAKVNDLRLGNNPMMTSLAGLDRVTSFRSLELYNLDALQLVGPLPSLRAVDILRLVNLPKVQSLAGLRAVTIPAGVFGVVELHHLDALTTLSDLKPLPAVFPGDVILQRPPLVTSYGFLRNLTEVTRNLELEDFSAAPPELDGLAKLDGELRIKGPMTSFTGLPSLVDVGTVAVDPDVIPSLTVLTLPSIVTIQRNLDVQWHVSSPASPCPRAALLRISLPALTGIGRSFAPGTSGVVAPTCQVDLHLPALSSHGIPIQLSFNGLHDLTLGPISAHISVSGFAAGTLVALRFTGRFTLQNINLQRLPLLQTITGPGGTLTGPLALINNPSLSQAAAQAWAATVTATPKTVQGNKSP